MLGTSYGVPEATFFQNRLAGSNFYPWWNRRSQPFSEHIPRCVWASLEHFTRIKFWLPWEVQASRPMKIMLLPCYDILIQIQRINIIWPFPQLHASTSFRTPWGWSSVCLWHPVRRNGRSVLALVNSDCAIGNNHQFLLGFSIIRCSICHLTFSSLKKCIQEHLVWSCYCCCCSPTCWNIDWKCFEVCFSWRPC